MCTIGANAEAGMQCRAAHSISGKAVKLKGCLSGISNSRDIKSGDIKLKGYLTQGLSEFDIPQPLSLISPIVKDPNSTVSLNENPALRASIAAARADGSGGSLSSVPDSGFC